MAVPVTTGMVTDTPVRPAVRAAAFRMLADLPGMRVIDGARDALGRTGTAVSMVNRFPKGAVFEERRGMPSGTRWHSYVIESAGWTDERPVLPK